MTDEQRDLDRLRQDRDGDGTPDLFQPRDDVPYWIVALGIAAFFAALGLALWLLGRW